MLKQMFGKYSCLDIKERLQHSHSRLQSMAVLGMGLKFRYASVQFCVKCIHVCTKIANNM